MTVVNQYRTFVQTNNTLPKHISEISNDLNEYSTLQEIEKTIWKDYAANTLEQCVDDPAFGEYIAREKMLAYVFSLLQNMSQDESQIHLQLTSPIALWTSPLLKNFKLEYLSFVKVLIEEGQERGEIQKRPFINKVYPDLFWVTLVSILSFWSKDKSAHKEQTDVAVEKLVNLLFDTIAPNAIDSALDLAQFMFKQNFNGNAK